MSGPDYTNEAQQRIMRLVMAIAGHELHGVSAQDMVQMQQCNASMVTRDIANLVAVGWVERIPETNRWRLAPSVVQIAMRHMVGLDRAKQKLAEIQHRYTRT